jgi:hypothetical protein
MTREQEDRIAAKIDSLADKVDALILDSRLSLHELRRLRDRVAALERQPPGEAAE